jgi:hypothetical protein
MKRKGICVKRTLVSVSALAAFLITISARAGGPEVVVIEPDYFSGFFVGATGAFHMAAFNGSSSVVAPQDVVITGVSPGPVPALINVTAFPAGTLANNDISNSAYDGYYGVQGGVGKVFNRRWYMGIMGFGEWGKQSKTADNTANFFTQTVVAGAATPSTIANGNLNSTTTVTLNNDYGLAVKPGFLVAPRSMVYGKIGAVWADLTVNNQVNGSTSATTDNPVLANSQINYSGILTGSSTQKHTKIGLLLGIGFEQFIYSDFVTFNVEYNYTNYGSVTTSTNIAGDGQLNIFSPNGLNTTDATLSPINAQATANARVSTLLGGLNVYFGSHWF